MTRRQPFHRRAIVGSAAVVALVAASCRPNEAPDPAPRGAVTTDLPGNGAIAFGRLDPREVEEGAVLFADLAVVDDEGEVRLLGARVGFRSPPAWSPDGERLALIGRSGLEVIGDDGERRSLARCRPDACTGLGPPVWTSEGDAILLGAELDGVTGLWSVPGAGGEPVLVAGGFEVIGAPTVAPDGRRAAVIVDRGAADRVLIVDLASGGIEDELAPDGVRFGDGVAWSPAGGELAVAVGVAGGAEGIYLMRLDGSGVRLLTSCPDDGCTDLGPAWSPDGTMVAFTRGRCDEPGSDCFQGDLFTIPAHGGEARPLTKGPGLDCCPAWQPVV
jgi:Tol biopolymer transport system component